MPSRPEVMVMIGRDGDENVDGKHESEHHDHEAVEREEGEHVFRQAEEKFDIEETDACSQMVALQRLGEEIGPGLPPLEVQVQVEKELMALRSNSMVERVQQQEQAGEGEAVEQPEDTGQSCSSDGMDSR